MSDKRNDETVLHGIINSDLPESDKTADRLTQEARVLVGAGIETTGSTLDRIVFGVLSHSRIHQRLKTELTEAASDETDLTLFGSLKSLPYLNAVINEGLRLAFAVSGRLARVDPRRHHIYNNYALPPGTVMSMGIRLMHNDPDVYEDPYRFNPERWLEPEKQKLLERNFVPFGRGSRSCIGRDLALLTVYVTIANIFHRFDAELFETDASDLAMEHDLFAPFPKAGSRGLSAKFF